MHDDLKALRERLETVYDLGAAANVLGWDQETYMPDGAAEARAQQLSTLRRLAHELFTSDEVGTFIDRLHRLPGEDARPSVDADLVRVVRRDFDRARRLPSRLVADLARESALAQHVWKSARASDDFSAFEPHLTTLLELTLQKAEALGYEEHPYDALLDEYEPDMLTSSVRTIFSGLRNRLVPIVRQISHQPQPQNAFLHAHYDPQLQWDFGMRVLRDIGYDLDRGRQDVSAHPFSTSFSVDDVRITTRIDERFFPAAFFSTLHEAGHALYEQGIDRRLARTSLADGTSLGMHESQSRLWENLIGRSHAFWQHYYPSLRKTFSAALSDVDLGAFYSAINRVEPSLIRVEADELTYNLHIMLRFELELDLIDGKLSVADLPEMWRVKMDEYIGLRPGTDADGVLQDVHWSLGAFGYFPTYTLGNLMSAQIFRQILTDLPELEGHVSAGRFDVLLRWLRDKIHRHGRARGASEILRTITGSDLSVEPWLEYVQRKWATIYAI